jgi:ATP-binding cassette subfamily C protein EexD
MTGFFSLFINMLMLTTPLYMLQVYDRVLASRSIGTLVAISILAGCMLLTFGILDVIRARILERVGARFDAQINQRIFDAMFARRLLAPHVQATEPLRDLHRIRQFLSGPGPCTLFDAPWVPFFLAIVFLFHPVLGFVATIGAVILFLLAWSIEIATGKRLAEAARETTSANLTAAASLRNAEVISALGMLPDLRLRWLAKHRSGLSIEALATDRAGTLRVSSRVVRMLLQIALLGVGAALAVNQSISPGAIVAVSIIAGRALAPVEQAIGHWQSFVATRSAYSRLSELLRAVPERAERMSLPTPTGHISVEGLVATPPGAKKPVLRGMSFQLEAGTALGVIGPSASGKSTLARLLIGVWAPMSGSVRLDGAEVHKLAHEEIGPSIGYLPQDVELFDGTVAENIARFAAAADPEQIVLAAKRATVHDMILRLPEGYDTRIGENGSFLSAGQRQRLALARALYGTPALVVLDEPNSNLDAEGDQALTKAILGLKKLHRTVIVMAHRPSAITAVDKLLVLKDGVIQSFGLKEEVLATMTAASSQDGTGKVARMPGQV